MSDGSAQLPAVRRADPDAEHGRGLLLVQALSDAFGVRVRPGGKAVWFHRRVPAGTGETGPSPD